LVKKPRQRRGKNRKRQAATPAPTIHLFDLNADIGEQNDLASDKPEMVGKLKARMAALDAEITENARSPWHKN
ncbi:MAG: arylsulfatase, partial [Limisphaerales bacterium]